MGKRDPFWTSKRDPFWTFNTPNWNTPRTTFTTGSTKGVGERGNSLECESKGVARSFLGNLCFVFFIKILQKNDALHKDEAAWFGSLKTSLRGGPFSQGIYLEQIPDATLKENIGNWSSEDEWPVIFYVLFDMQVGWCTKYLLDLVGIPCVRGFLKQYTRNINHPPTSDWLIFPNSYDRCLMVERYSQEHQRKGGKPR